MEKKDNGKLILIAICIFLFCCFCFSMTFTAIYVMTNRFADILPINQDFDDTRCWNRVISDTENRYYWPDGCRGEKRRDFCTQVLVELNTKDVIEYKKWEALGKPPINGCGSVKGD